MGLGLFCSSEQKSTCISALKMAMHADSFFFLPNISTVKLPVVCQTSVGLINKICIFWLKVNYCSSEHLKVFSSWEVLFWTTLPCVKWYKGISGKLMLLEDKLYWSMKFKPWWVHWTSAGKFVRNKVMSSLNHKYARLEDHSSFRGQGNKDWQRHLIDQCKNLFYSHPLKTASTG